MRNSHLLPARWRDLYDTLLERITALPGVRSASQSGMTPLSGTFWMQNVTVPHGLKDAVLCSLNTVSQDYFETMGTPVRLGRDFNRKDTAESPRVAVINEAFAREAFGPGNPLGRTVRQRLFDKYPSVVREVSAEVIGVVKDARYNDLRQPAPPTIYLPSSQRTFGQHDLGDTVFELRSTGPAENMIPAVRHAIAQESPNTTMQFREFSTQVKDSLVQERALATLSTFFGALALILASVGLYGLMSYTVGRRRGEIGVRMALGAQQQNVLWMILRDSSMLAIVGVVVGGPAALASARLVSSKLYGVAPEDASTLTISAVILLAAGVLAGYLPARRAARLDPMTALREE